MSCVHADLYIAILATLKAGGAYVPMDPEYPADRLVLMAEDSEVVIITYLPSSGHHSPAHADTAKGGQACI